MKTLVAATLIAAVFVCTAPLLTAADAAAGKEVYGKKCASCHGVAGEGKATIAKQLKVQLRPLGSKEVQAKTDVQLKKDFMEGNGKMKAVKDLDAKAADDLIAYMRTLKN